MLQNNPLCGDEITIFVNEKEGQIAEVAFQGRGVLHLAELRLDDDRGRSGSSGGRGEDARGRLRGMMGGGVEPDEDEFGDLIALSVVKYPIRIKCAVLAWDVLQEALDGAEGSAAGSAPHAV